jgi:ribonuclease HI
MTWKELRAVRHAIESFQLRGRNVLLHGDSIAVVTTLTDFTTRFPIMMTGLRRL